MTCLVCLGFVLCGVLLPLSLLVAAASGAWCRHGQQSFGVLGDLALAEHQEGSCCQEQQGQRDQGGVHTGVGQGVGTAGVDGGDGKHFAGKLSRLTAQRPRKRVIPRNEESRRLPRKDAYFQRLFARSG